MHENFQSSIKITQFGSHFKILTNLCKIRIFYVIFPGYNSIYRKEQILRMVLRSQYSQCQTNSGNEKYKLKYGQAPDFDKNPPQNLKCALLRTIS